jgi:citrate lyase subunit beta/citryl-CoA lyase
MGLDATFLLFVPGDRPDRFAKALRSGASGAILDLEDAVAADRKAHARGAIDAFLRDAVDLRGVAVRVNATGSPWFDDDLAMLGEHPILAIVLPKADGTASLDRVRRALPDVRVIALIESARGVVNAPAIAAHAASIAVAFGPYDLAADLGGVPDWDVMLPYRAHVLAAARAAGRLAIDGPATSLSDRDAIFAESQRAARLGYDGKMLIHPAQIEPARAAFRPSDADVREARRIVAAAADAMPAVLDGAMIDEPMLAAARRLLARASATAP